MTLSNAGFYIVLLPPQIKTSQLHRYCINMCSYIFVGCIKEGCPHYILIPQA